MSIGTRTKFPGILKTLLLLQVFCFFVCLEAFQPRRPEHLHGQLDGKLEKRRPVPISLEDSPHNLTTASVDLQLGLINLRHNLRKRAVDFQHYICKGERALNMIVHDPPAIRTWTREDFTRSGWSTYNDANSVSADLVPALNGLGVPHAPQDIRPVFANHFNEFTDRNGKIAPATQGFYHNKYIPGSKGKGAIISEANFSPNFQREKAGSKAEIPPLNRWSDAVWLLWSEQAGNQAGNLRYIFRDKVRNEVTRGIIEDIHGLEEHPDTLNLPWPGHSYDMRTDDGKALLGTPQGIGIAYLIRDHSNTLGRKIPFARVFSVSNRPPSVSGSGGGYGSNEDSNHSGSSNSGSGSDAGDGSDNSDEESSGDSSSSGGSSDGSSGSESSGSGSSGSGSNGSGASAGPPVYKWDYYVVWELRDTATG